MRNIPGNSRIWAIASIILLGLAALFWHLGEKRRHAIPAVVPASQQASNSVSVTNSFNQNPKAFHLLTNPQDLSMATASTDKAGLLSTASKKQRVASGKSGSRLSNTDQPVKELMRNERAILLRNAWWDASVAVTPDIPETLRASGDPGSYIVQSSRPGDGRFPQLLADSGATIVSYVPNNAYLVRASSTVAQQLASSPMVNEVLPYEPYYKLDERLLPLAIAGQALHYDAMLQVVLFADAREEGMRALQDLVAEVISESRSPFGPLITVRPVLTNWVALAQLPAVQEVEFSHSRRLLNDLARVKLGVSTNVYTNSTFIDLSGSNVLVNVNDSGVDATHPALSGRVLALNNSELRDTIGHGTHVAGTIAGNGAKSEEATNAVGSVTNADFRGMAPAAKVYVLPFNSAISDVYLQENAARTNAWISNNSWSNGNAEYDLSAASFDAAVRDALPEMTGQQGITFVFAAGNSGFGNSDGSGGEPGSIVSPATAKNVITVGSLDQPRNITNEVAMPDTDGNLVTNQVFIGVTDSEDQVSPMSSRGNVGVGTEGLTGRFKPDVVAPGEFIISTRSQQWLMNTNPAHIIPQTINNQQIAPGALNNYYIYVPNNAARLEIRLLPGSIYAQGPLNLPIFVRKDNYPDAIDFDVMRNDEVILPRDGNLSPGDWYYSVGNNGDKYKAYNIETVLTLTNYYGTYYDVLKQLDDGLGKYYRFNSGSSMAAPMVSGMLALMKEFFEQKLPPELRHTNSPALMKALIINGARSVNPMYDLQVSKSLNTQGWGVPNLTNCLPVALLGGKQPEAPMQYFDQNTNMALATGERVAWKLAVNSNAVDNPLRLTLVWTDPPGNPNAAIKLVNDLDLVVTNLDTGEIYWGNDIPNGSDFNSTFDTNAVDIPRDVVNNVENVFIRSPGSNYTVGVIARRVNVNAVTGNSNKIAQDFALVVSSGNLTLSNALSMTLLTNSVERMPTTVMTNGIPLLNERVSANSPLLGTTNGTVSQWRFYVFTNLMFTNMGTMLTNGQYVAFITFMPPNLAVPRNKEADIDLYVSTDNTLTNLNPTAIAKADKSLKRGGTELVFYTNSLLGTVYYIGVKSEDQQGGEYGFISISSDQPFDQGVGNGRMLRGYPVPIDIPDGSPSKPGAALMFAIGTFPSYVGRVVVNLTLNHENMGDLVGNLSHDGAFVVLNNHSLNDDKFSGTNVFIYDDSNQGDNLLARPTDGPGRLSEFIGQSSIGVWILAMVDDALGNTGRVENLFLTIDPEVAPGGLIGTVLPNSWDYYHVDIPEEATNLLVYVWDFKPPLPLNIYVRRADLPTLAVYDKFAIADPATITNAADPILNVSIYDAPPLIPGRYFIGVYNPNAASVTYRIDAKLDFNLAGSAVQAFSSRDTPKVIKDDAVTYSTNFVGVNRRIVDVRVGLRVDHPRVSDLAMHLISPQGTRVLLVENRGWTNASGFGTGDTNSGMGYLVLTERTNLTTTPIKFAQPPYTNNIVTFSAFQDGFELATATNYLAGDIFNGWQVLTNQVSVENNPALAYGGTKVLNLNMGWISRDLPTKSGKNYKLEFMNCRRPADPSLVSFWPADNNGRDAQGNNNATPSGIGYNAGMVGNAFEFNGTNGYVRIPPSSGLAVSNFTIEGWVYPADLSIDRPLIEYGLPSGKAGVQLWTIASAGTNSLSPGSLTANIRDTSGVDHIITPSSSLLAPNQWSHLALTYNATNGRAVLFLNGKIVAQKTMGQFTPATAGVPIFLGYRSPTSLEPVQNVRFSGRIDELAIFNRPLTTAEILEIANAGSLGKGATSFYPNYTTNGVELALQGVSTNIFVATNQWKSTVLSFTAPTNGARLSFKSPAMGTVIDEVSLSEISADSYFLPEESLDAFQDEIAYGDWRLEITDSRAGPATTNIVPTLVSWQLQMVFATPVRTAVTLTNGVPYFSFIEGNEIKYFIVQVPRAATFATNWAIGSGDIILFGSRTGLPAGDPQYDDYYVDNAGAGAGEYLLLSTNSPAGAPLQPGRRYYLGVKNANPNETNSFAILVQFDKMDFPNLTYVYPLFNGLPVTATITNGPVMDYYYYMVSTNASAANFELWPTNGNVNLLVRRYLPVLDPLPTAMQYDYRSLNPGTNTDWVTVTTNSFPVSLTPGIWLLGVVNMETFPVTYTIRASETNVMPINIVTLTNGVPLDYRIPPGGLNDFFKFSIMDSNAAARFSLYNLSGRADLILRRGNLPSRNLMDAGSFQPNLTPEAIIIRTNGVPASPIVVSNFLINPGMTVVSNTLNLSWISTPGQIYTVRGKTNITDLMWDTVSQPIIATSTNTSYSVTLPSPYRFFIIATSLQISSDVVFTNLNGDWYLAVLNNETTPINFTIRASLVPAITTITNTQVLTNTLPPGPSWTYYEFQVSSNATMAMFEAIPTNGDVGLYLRQNTGETEPWPTLAQYDYFSDLSGINPEQIIVYTNSLPQPLSEGTWLLGVYNGSTNAVTFTVGAWEFYEPVPLIIPLENGVTFTNLIYPTNVMDYYSFLVSSNASQVLFETAGADGNIDVYARRGLPLPNPTNYFYASTNLATNDERILVSHSSAPVALAPGTWFLCITNLETNLVNYTIKATEFQPLPLTNLIINPRLVISNGFIGVTWSSVVGAAYRLEGRIKITDPGWNVIASDIIATETNTTYWVPLTNLNRFFRVLQTSAPAPPQPPSTNLVINPRLYITNNSLAISWSSVVGLTYRLDGRVKVTDPAWTVVASNIVATATNTTYFVPLTNQNRFFRVVQTTNLPVQPPVISTNLVLNTHPVVVSNTLALAWSSTIGATYRLDGRVNITDTNWNVLASNIVASSTNTTYYLPLPSTNRFFRVVQTSQSQPPTVAKPVISLPATGVSTNGFILQWTANPSSTYRVEVSTNLVNWLELTNLVATSASQQFTDTTAVAADKPRFRFYRVILMP